MKQRKQLPIVQVDAFSGTAFGGNPAAVCLVPPEWQPDLDDTARQQIAAEMNLSETAFVEHPEGDFAGATSFGLRWFTPTCEVPLCGHATLAAAAALFATAGNRNATVSFTTLSGELRVTNCATACALDSAEGGDALDVATATAAAADASEAGSQLAPWLAMELPLLPPDDEVPSQLAAGSALVQAATCGLGVREVLFRRSLGYLVIVLRDGTTREQLEFVHPDPGTMLAAAPRASAGGPGVTGVILTTQGGAGEDGEQGHDFVSRFFGPWLGVDEDPVTGSAHCVLAPYWAKRTGKSSLRARQCSTRGGELRLQLPAPEAQVSTDGRHEAMLRVEGQAVVVLEGKLYL